MPDMCEGIDQECNMIFGQQNSTVSCFGASTIEGNANTPLMFG